MASDSRPPVRNPASREYRRGEWAILCSLTNAWRATAKTGTLEAALRPFLEFVWRHQHFPIKWKHRLYILWMGRLPLDF
jgi:hypothetical protein